MNYRFLFIALFVSGCRIPGDHFIPIGGGDAGGDGGRDDSGVDAPPAMSLSKGYIVDDQDGIYRVSKNVSTGALTAASGSSAFVSIAMPHFAITNRAGTHLFVSAGGVGVPNEIRMYPIASDGSLGNVVMRSAGCEPGKMALHPSGQWIAVECNGPMVLMVGLDNNGVMTTSTPLVPVPVTTALRSFAFNNAGTCLYGVDQNSAQVQIFTFEQSGQLTPEASRTGPGNAISVVVHPNGQYLYVAGIDLHPYTIPNSGVCDLVPNSADIVTSISPTFPSKLVFQPDGLRMFALADGLRTFTIGANGKPTLSATNSLTGIVPTAGIIDPGFPSTIYVSVRGGTGAGVLRGQIQSDGTVTQVGSSLLPNGASSTVWFAMAP